MATGRSPLTADLFGASGVRDSLQFRPNGTIQVDAQQQTAVPGVYAVGDVASDAALTPVAIAAGRLLSDRLFNGAEAAALDYSQIPTAVFSHPPIGTVGLTEEQATSAHGAEAVITHRSGFRSLFYGMFPDDGPVHKAKSLMKLVCVKQEGSEAAPGSERVVGVHMIGPASDELVQAVAIAVKMGATKKDFDSAIAVHPTAAEELVTMQPWTPHYGPSSRV
jgi:glutathione reductase (NADPH)